MSVRVRYPWAFRPSFPRRTRASGSRVSLYNNNATRITCFIVYYISSVSRYVRSSPRGKRTPTPPTTCVCVCYFFWGKNSRETRSTIPRDGNGGATGRGGPRNRLGRRVHRRVSGPSPFGRDGLHEDITQHTHTAW